MRCPCNNDKFIFTEECYICERCGQKIPLDTKIKEMLKHKLSNRQGNNIDRHLGDVPTNHQPQ